MGKPRLFRIVFDNNVSTFFAGQSVSGHLLIENDVEITNISGITLKFVGQSTVKWHERVTRKKHPHERGYNSNYQTYRNDELYFEHEMYVFGNGSTTNLPTGRFTFPFAFALPQCIPSSFEGQFGNVRYFVKSSILRGLLKFDYRIKQHFTVNAILDLNQEPNVHLGYEGSKTKSLCCLCCKSGPISAFVQIPRTGYAPGQVIQISGEVDNKSNTSMNQSYARLVQTVTFKALRKSKRVRGTVAKIIHGEIQPGNSYTWNDEPMFIPPLPPSRLDYCNIIDVSYALEFHVDPSGVSFDLVIIIPITIGNIPILSTMEQFANQQVRSFDPFRATLPQQLTAYPHLPPPSYEQFMAEIQFENGQENEAVNFNLEDEDEDKTNFTPSYLTWRAQD